MARTLKTPELRRGEILDVARRLVYSQGYERMTIQDILNELRMSKGAFYHYFGSKQALLEALIERMLDEVEQVVIPIVQNPDLPALEKLQRYFATAARWKTDRKAYLLAMLRVWYADENAIVREKVRTMAVKRITPWLAAIIHQGIREGVLAATDPEQSGEVVLWLIQGLGETYSAALLEREVGRADLQRIERTVATYTRALERILGAPPGSLILVDGETTAEWFGPQEAPGTTSGEVLAENLGTSRSKLEKHDVHRSAVQKG